MREIKEWPSIYFNDICVFILSKHPGKDVRLPQVMLNDYKEGKVYRYVNNDWLKEVFLPRQRHGLLLFESGLHHFNAPRSFATSSLRLCPQDQGW